MKNVMLMLGGAALVLTAAGCSEGRKEGTLTVQGTLSARTRATDNTRAVAIADDGSQTWAYLDTHGDFSLDVPVGRSYRIVLANQLSGGGQRKIGHVVLGTANAPSEWLGANEPGTVDLGRLRLATTASTSGMKPLCGGCGGGGDDDDHDDDRDDEADEKSNHDDDHECRRDEGPRKPRACDDCDDDDDDDRRARADDECDVCSDDDDKALKPSKEPGEKCEDRDKDKHSKKTDRDDDKRCTKKTPEKSDKGSGDKKPGDRCETTSSCTSGCSCIAAKCEEK
jgi:hypothetical protein